MLKLGNWNELVIVRFTDHGAYLDGGDVGEVLMPKSYVLREMHPGDRVRVWYYDGHVSEFWIEACDLELLPVSTPAEPDDAQPSGGADA